MGDRYLDSTAGAASTPFETWGDAAATLQAIITDGTNPLLAGEKIFVAADHTEDPGASITYTFPGTAASPNVIISSLGGSSPVSYLAATVIQLDNNGGIRDIVMRGNVKFIGLSMRSGDDLRHDDPNDFIMYENCTIELSHSSSVFEIGDATGKQTIHLKNTDINFSTGGSLCGIDALDPSNFIWEGGTLSWTGTQPTSLFGRMDEIVMHKVIGVDLSAITSILYDLSENAVFVAELTNCLLNSSVTLVTGTTAVVGTKIIVSGCDDTTGNKLYRFEYYDNYGVISHTDTIYMKAGANDGDQTISWLMAPLTTVLEAAEFALVSPPLVTWVDSVGSKDFVVNCLVDNATDMEDDEIWLEVEYLGASANTQSTFANNKRANILATPAVSGRTTILDGQWEHGMSNPNHFQLTVTATVGRVGFARARVFLAKDQDVYIDPRLVVTAA